MAGQQWLEDLAGRQASEGGRESELVDHCDATQQQVAERLPECSWSVSDGITGGQIQPSPATGSASSLLGQLLRVKIPPSPTSSILFLHFARQLSSRPADSLAAIAAAAAAVAGVAAASSLPTCRLLPAARCRRLARWPARSRCARSAIQRAGAVAWTASLPQPSASPSTISQPNGELGRAGGIGLSPTAQTQQTS